MDTPSHVASRIVAAAVTRFADDNGIVSGHLTDDTENLTTVEVVRATRALGAEVIFGA